ncbi:MAG: response regulator [Candidatus Aegiribacteria sp.]|nr:response regulator [Candidatus Aegiribacteria sp.]
MNKKNDDIQAERDFYRRQCDDMGRQILRLQQELTQVHNDAKRIHTTTSLILKTYELINHDVSVEDIGKRFLQVILSTMWVDRAMVLRYDKEVEAFISQYYLGLKQDSSSVLRTTDTFPEFLFVNSNTESTPVTDSFCNAIESKYILWYFNRYEGVALLIGNDMEDRKFRLPFMEKDRDIIESSLNVFIDIVRRKEAEIALLESEGRYRSLVQSSPESIFVSCDDRLTLVNNAGLKLLGASSSKDVIEHPLLDFIHPDEHEIIMKMIADILENNHESPLTERRFKRIDGSIVDVEIVAIPFTFQDRAAVQIVALDITERRKMEEEQAKVQKIESLGVLAGGIAHDFNNILTGILGNIDLAKTYSNPESEAYEFLQDALNASTRAKELTYKLLTFSKGGSPLKKSTSIAEIITDSVNFILSGSSIKYEYSQPDDLWPVDIDVVQFRQVIENLTINAQQAMQNGGVLTIRTENAGSDTEQIPSRSIKRYVKLTVKDSGVGIPEENLQKIFDPYFTTKEKGNGLGLATAYSIIKKHEGLIRVESTIGEGTTFFINIPASDKKPSARKTNLADMKAGEGYILIMDDDRTVRMVALGMLKSSGFEAVSAKDGQEAIELYTAAGNSDKPFDVVILDLTVPGGMGGQETVKKLLEIDPDVKAVVSSGYAKDPILANYKDYGFKGIIPKPFNIKELCKSLLKVMNKG